MLFFFFFCKKKFPIYFGGGCQFKINSYKTYFIYFCRRRNSYVHHVAVLLTSLANEAIGYSRNLTIYIFPKINLICQLCRVILFPCVFVSSFLFSQYCVHLLFVSIFTFSIRLVRYYLNNTYIIKF